MTRDLLRDAWGVHGMALPKPDDIVHYVDGSFLPVMFHYVAESCSLRAVAAEHDLEIKIIEMETALGPEHPLVERYHEGDAVAVRLWEPEPYLDEWRLVGKTDSEDGPIALYVRALQAPSLKKLAQLTASAGE